MAQPLLLAALYVLGVTSAVALGPRRDALVCGVIGFPLGLAVGVAAVMAMIFVGAPVTRASAAVVWVVLAAAAAVVAWRRGGADLRVLAACAAAFAGVLAVVSAIAPTVLDRESARLVAAAQQAAADDLILDTVWRRLSRVGMFPLVARALLHDAPLGAALAASALALAGVLIWRARSALPLLLLLGAIAVTALVARHPATHVAAATYLFVFATRWASGLTTDPKVSDTLSLIALGALAVQSSTGPFVAAPILLGAIVHARSRAAVPGVIALVAVLIAWWTLPASKVSDTLLVVGAVAAFAAVGGLALVLTREVDEPLLAPLGGRDRALGLVVAATLVVVLAGNVRRLTANQRLLPERWRITAHDTFDVERATEGMRARSIELLERER